MIKKFDDFNIDEIKDNERNHFERELNARKKMREERGSNTDFDFEDIKDFIITEIQDGEDYHITTGKRMVNVTGIKDEDIHIEYQSSEAGRIRIFKPKDESTDGYYEINGKMYKTDADDIRNFYHYLNQEIKKKPIMNESVRDQMKPKSEEEIDDSFEDVANDIADILVDQYDYDDWLNAYEWAQDHKEEIMESIDDDPVYNLEDIIQKILYGWEGTNESVRDLMKPKSGEEMEKVIQNHLKNVPKDKLPLAKLLVGCEHDLIELVEEGIEEGADIHFADEIFLISAARYGYVDIVKLLLDLGADPSAQDNYAYRLATAFGYHEIVELVKRKDSTNESVRDLMLPKTEEEVRKSFDAGSKTPDEKLRLGIKNDALWLVKMAIEEGADINVRMNSKKADINCKRSQERNPLTIASINGQTEIAKYLIENGANINILDDYGYTPLIHASSHGHLEIVKCLVENGADINIKTNAKKTALMIASNNDNKEVVDYLKEFDKTKIPDKIEKPLNNYTLTKINKPIEKRNSRIKKFLGFNESINTK